MQCPTLSNVRFQFQHLVTANNLLNDDSYCTMPPLRLAQVSHPGPGLSPLTAPLPTGPALPPSTQPPQPTSSSLNSDLNFVPGRKTSSLEAATPWKPLLQRQKQRWQWLKMRSYKRWMPSDIYRDVIADSTANLRDEEIGKYQKLPIQSHLTWRPVNPSTVPQNFHRQTSNSVG